MEYRMSGISWTVHFTRCERCFGLFHKLICSFDGRCLPARRPLHPPNDLTAAPHSYLSAETTSLYNGGPLNVAAGLVGSFVSIVVVPSTTATTFWLKLKLKLIRRVQLHRFRSSTRQGVALLRRRSCSMEQSAVWHSNCINTVCF